MTTESDRELLELAAKANGKIHYDRSGLSDVFLEFRGDHMYHWNPLEDDGDALRLATAIGVFDGIKSFEKFFSWLEDAQEVIDDDSAAFRRAITCYAAEIGRNMK